MSPRVKRLQHARGSVYRPRFWWFSGSHCWLASHDWIMSLEPEWTSTMFGVYNFAGLFLSSLAATTLLVVWLSSRGDSTFRVTKSQLHDLGTLLFAFSSFWMYLWFCQYWLIWYVNIPEETAYFVRRSHGNWPVLSLLNLTFNWGVPFVVLLFRSAKRSPRILGIVALVVLIGRWLDLTLMIFPSQGDRGAGLRDSSRRACWWVLRESSFWRSF